MKPIAQLLFIAVIFTAFFSYCSKQPKQYSTDPQWIDLSAPRSKAILYPDGNREFIIRIAPMGMNTADKIGMPVSDEHLILTIEYNGIVTDVDKSLTTVASIIDNILTFNIWDRKYSNYYKGVGPVSVKVKTNSRIFGESWVYVQYKE